MTNAHPQSAEAIARSVDSLETEDEINKALDETEFVFELLDPEFQEAADQIVSLLSFRVREIRRAGG